LDYISNPNPQFIGRIWVVSIGVKEKPSTWEGFDLDIYPKSSALSF